MGEILMRLCDLFGHGELKRVWYEYKHNPPGIYYKGEYITSCKRCGMIVRIER
jgi:hypothetical protein